MSKTIVITGASDGIGAAAAVTVPTGHGITTADFKCCTQHILCGATNGSHGQGEEALQSQSQLRRIAQMA